MATANDIDLRAGRVNVYAPPGDDVTFTVLVRGMGYESEPTATVEVGSIEPSLDVTWDEALDIVSVTVTLTDTETLELGAKAVDWRLRLEAGGAKKTLVGGSYIGDRNKPSSNNAVVTVQHQSGSVSVNVVGGGGFMSSAAVLAALLAVDGPGTGLNADLLDGQHATAFEAAGAASAAQAAAIAAVPAIAVVQADKQIKKAREGNALRTVTLACGADDETVAVTNCTSSVDTTNYKVGDRAWKMTMAGAVTAQLRWDPVSPDEDPLVHPPASAVGIWVYCPDASKVDYVEVDIYQADDLSIVWTRTSLNAGVTLQNGWNLVRWAATASVYSGWGSIYRLRVVVDTNAATDVTIGHVWLECPEKASILFVEDSGYLSFYTAGYPRMQASRYPVTWAVNPTLLGTNTGSSTRISEAQFHTAMASANGDSASFHGWDGTATSAMTAAQIRTDTIKAQKWLSRNGPYAGRFWRAAWVQNLATNGAAATPYLWAGSSISASSGAFTAFPIPSGTQHDLPRYVLHGRSEADLDTVFTTLETTHGLLNCYTHGVDDAGGIHITTAMWDYFLDKVDTGVDEGWLEVVTMQDLFIRSGGRFIDTSGGMTVEWPDEAGVLQRMIVP